jgi:penicillin-binding protein 1A
MNSKFLTQVKSFLIRQYSRFRQQSLLRKTLLIAGSLMALGGAFIVTFVLMVWAGFFGRLPDKKELAEVENPAATEVYSADSVLLGRYFIQERSTIRYEDLPKHVEQALLATEDVRFYDHKGIDVISLFRVLVKSVLLQNESSGGGSTITQQLAKNLYPRKSHRYLSLPINKVREMIIAWRLESVYDKKSILTLYLNTIPFADNTYGIDAAAQRFFSVRTNKLGVEQGAVLVGMLKATHLYNPRLFPDRARNRRDVVFGQMVKYEMLDAEKAAKLTEAPLKLKYKLITRHKGLAPYFRSHIRKELLEWARENKKSNGEPYDIYTDGLKVYTTLDSRMQKYAEEAVKSQMTLLQKKFDQHWASREPWYNQPQVVRDAVRRSSRYRGLQEQGLPENEIQKIMERKVPMTIFTWQGQKEVKMSPLDSVKHYLKFLNAGFIAMEPQTGAVRAWVGGIDHNYFEYDHVKTTTKRQVGSTFKPIVYAAALEKGVKPCDFISAEKTTYTNIEDMDVWSPSNNDGNYEFKYSMEGALAYSVNTVSVKVLEKAGISNTISLARKMGISSSVPDVPSIALGVADISMTEMVAAYASFVNNGKSVKPIYITSITTGRGKQLYSAKPEKQEQVLSPRTAEMMVHMLKRTVNEGTAGKLRWEYGVYNDLGGKTGTTQSNADGWFISVAPKLVVGAWVGADDPRVRFRATSLGQGSSTALPITAKFYQALNKDKNLRDVSQSKFPALSRSAQSALGCPLYKSDMNFWESIFGVPEEKKEIRRDFGDDPKKKKNLLRKLFKKKDLSASIDENGE